MSGMKWSYISAVWNLGLFEQIRYQNKARDRKLLLRISSEFLKAAIIETSQNSIWVTRGK
ncbi:unnamed protein product [Larinioides sclopetarius]|uniref:Uncharacterized protein n=1 Tax=Larinioides sclopetarius TaxID=280406 RepID=A0AAV1ZI38_9ARAC